MSRSGTYIPTPHIAPELRPIHESELRDTSGGIRGAAPCEGAHLPKHTANGWVCERCGAPAERGRHV